MPDAVASKYKQLSVIGQAGGGVWSVDVVLGTLLLPPAPLGTLLRDNGYCVHGAACDDYNSHVCLVTMGVGRRVIMTMQTKYL